MDKGTSNKEKVNYSERYELPKTVDPNKIGNVIHVLGKLDEIHDDLVSDFHNDAQAIFSSKKAFVRIEQVFDITNTIAKEIFVANFSLQYVRQRLAILETIIKELTQKLNIELPNVKSEMQSLKKTIVSEDFATISQFVKRIQEDMDKYNKKMEENDLAE